MKQITIAIPTLARYDLLERLCNEILREESIEYKLRIVILDNGGNLSTTNFLSDVRKHKPFDEALVEIMTPGYNLGVAGSWNYFAKELGRCIIANDDVIFSKSTIDCFEKSSISNPKVILFENSKPNEGFSTFLLNQPKVWLEMGGFDEVFNPAYFEDLDCKYRLALSGNPVGKVDLEGWHHDNSSTLNNSSYEYKRMHWCLYLRNQKYYSLKWGGKPGKEKFRSPFNQ